MRRPQLDAELGVPYRLPQPPAPAPQPQAFCLYPLGTLPGIGASQWCMMQQIYQLAFAQAQAVARPSLPERDILAIWN
jgi:hypothetical protein